MVDKLDNALHFNREALNLRAERQKVLANNIANADTPNFKAKDFDFASELKSAVGKGRASGRGIELSTTSSRHLSAHSSRPAVRDLQYRVPDQPSLDGNTVDMDVERANFADNSMRYQASLTMMKSSISRLKAAMQPE